MAMAAVPIARERRMAISDLPLDETALLAAHRAVVAAGIRAVDGLSEDEEDRIFVSAYLRKAGFQVERRLVGPRVPVVQAESREGE